MKPTRDAYAKDLGASLSFRRYEVSVRAGIFELEFEVVVEQCTIAIHQLEKNPQGAVELDKWSQQELVNLALGLTINIA